MNKAQRLNLFKPWLWAFFIALGSVAVVHALPIDTYWLCRSGAEVRTLRVETDQSLCVGWYTKQGVDEKVAESKETQLCREVILRIKETLESSAWKCKNISNSKISQ